MTARETVLDAYEAVIAERGSRGATLEAVAACAGVSKGGLLYHFASKDALAVGLFERLAARGEADIDAMRRSGESASVYYVRTSAFTDTPLDRTLVAVARLASENHSGARDALRATRERWLDLVTAEVGDRARAHAILLIGDGLYYDAAFTAEHDDAAEARLDELLRVVGQLAASPDRP